MRAKRCSKAGLAFKPVASAGQWSESYVINLLTPMIGGGTESWQVDTAQPIRASEIKQQLRFWWRTMQDPAISTKELLGKESALFGDTSRASPVRLHIKQDKQTDQQKLVITRDELLAGRSPCPKYVLFPLLGQKDKNQHYIEQFTLLQKFYFTLEIAEAKGSDLTAAQTAEMTNTAKLWLLFGGLGARTRRGAGSLYCADMHDTISSAAELTALVQNMLPKHIVVPSSAYFPVLRGARLVLEPLAPNLTPIKGWDQLLGLHDPASNPPGYGDLRQGKNIARGRGAARPGRSHWPEADALRKLAGTWSPMHAPRTTPGEWYPRAAYGLPIEFKFNTNAQYGGHPHEPAGKFNLLPADPSLDRWPSPLVLKLVRLHGRFYKLGLLLNHRIPDIRCDRNGIIAKSAHPDSHVGKHLPMNFPIPVGHPHDGLFAKLFPKATVYDI